MHTNEIYLRDVKFIVSEAGRQRVLKEKRKNVHAFVEGNIVFDDAFKAGVLIFPSACDFDCKTLVKYNPYKAATFYTEDGVAIEKCQEVYINNKEVWANDRR